MTRHLSPTMPTSEKISLATHATFWISALSVLVFVLWASISTLDIVSHAGGEVIPSSQVKTVQHLEGGIVREIRVVEGQKVDAEQPLVVLEPTVSGAEVAELRIRQIQFETDIAQFEALAAGADAPVFPDTLKDEHPDLVSQARTRFETRLEKHRNTVRRQEQVVIQRRQEIDEITQRIVGGGKSLELVEEQIRMSEELLRKNLVNRFRHLDLLKEGRELRGAVDTDRAGLARARSSLSEAQAELASIQSTFADEVQRALEEARLGARELKQRLRKFEDSLDRTVVRSPVKGVVKTLNVVTVGGVVKPGEPVAEIVPLGDTLVVEAKLPTQDIGYVSVGQKAGIKLASSDAVRFGVLIGAVTEVSPDTLINADGVPFYRVRITLGQDYFENGVLRYALFPGMQVAVSIQTGTRTVMQYILDPLLYRMGNAFQER
ncbi:MAG: HlyD family type I secretion periplasmic adaptor subunit [Rhodospirillales bacterium]